MVLDILQRGTKTTKKRKTQWKIIKVTMLLVKENLPEFIIPIPEGIDKNKLQAYRTLEFNGEKLLVLGPYKKEDIICIDNAIADWLLNHYGDRFFEKIYIK